MGRQPCCEKIGLRRGSWTTEEDSKLVDFILNNGITCWRMVPKLAGLMRCGKSCRLRWMNYLRPDLKRGGFTESEEDMIIELHSQLGNRWSKIASHFPGRTDNEIKNHWNTRIKKKLKLLGRSPVTHRPIEQDPITENDETTIYQSMELQETTDDSSSCFNDYKEGTSSSSSGSDQNKNELFEKGNAEFGSLWEDDDLFLWDGLYSFGLEW